MNIRKLIIIVIAIVGLAAILFVILKFRTPVKESVPISTIPAVSPSLPSAVSSSLSSPTRDQYIKISNPNNADEIKKVFNGFVNESVTPQTDALGLKAIKLVDSQGKPLSLKAVFSEIGAAVPESLADFIDGKDYEIFYCPAGSEKKEYGLVLYAKSIESRPLDEKDYQNISDKLKQWESAMFGDLHSLLFPNITFPDAEVSQSLQFQNGTARFAEVQLPVGAKSSINYKQLGAPVIFASSLDCLNDGIGYFFDVEEK